MRQFVLALVVCGLSVTGFSADESARITKAMTVTPQVKVKKPYKVLVYHKASGFKHKSIPVVNQAIQIMGEKTGAFSVTLTEKVEDFTAENLKQYDLLLFNNTTHVQKAFTEDAQRAAIMDFVKGGKGFVAIHSATDAGYDGWPEYTEMIGGVFDGHPWGAGGTWALSVDDGKHPIMSSLTENFTLKDEIYKYKSYDRSKCRVLCTIDTRVEGTNKGPKNRKDNDQAVIWVKDWGKGRVFVSALGHNNHLCWDTRILQLWLNGIQFAAGDLKGDTTTLPQPAWQTAK